MTDEINPVTDASTTFPDQTTLVVTPSRAPKDESMPALSKTYVVIYVIIGFLGNAVNGSIDGGIGPVLLSFQRYYDVSYSKISLLFLCYSIGNFFSACFNQFFVDRFGFGKIMVVFSALFYAAGSGVLAAGVPFGVFLGAFFWLGFGYMTQSCQISELAQHLGNPSFHMFLTTAGYGIGGALSTVIATAFAEHYPERFYYFYFYLMALSLTNSVVFALVIRGRAVDKLPAMKRTEVEDVEEVAELAEMTGVVIVPEATEMRTWGKLIKMIKMRETPYLIVANILVTSIEYISIGWSVAYVETVKHGGPHSGYTATAYFLGVTIGRVSFPAFTRQIGPNRAFSIYLVACGAFSIIMWRVPQAWVSSVMVGLSGSIVGMFFPILTNTLGDIYPTKLFAGALGCMEAFCGLGMGAFPFIFGALANSYGVDIYPIVVLSLSGVLLVLWSLGLMFGIIGRAPDGPKRAEDEKRDPGVEVALEELHVVR